MSPDIRADNLLVMLSESGPLWVGGFRFVYPEFRFPSDGVMERILENDPRFVRDPDPEIQENISKILKKKPGRKPSYFWKVREGEKVEPFFLKCHPDFDFGKEGSFFLPPISYHPSMEYSPTPLHIEDNLWKCPKCESRNLIADVKVGYCTCGAQIVLDKYGFSPDSNFIELEVISEIMKDISFNPGSELEIQGIRDNQPLFGIKKGGDRR